MPACNGARCRPIRRATRGRCALLRELDAQGYARIVVQAPPANDAWHAVSDRIGRPAAFTLDTSDL